MKLGKQKSDYHHPALRIGGFILLLPYASAGFAQSSSPDIVVTGASLPPSPGEVAYDVITIDRARLSDTASGRLEDVLRDAAGFAQFRRSDSRSAQPTSQGATFRGLGGNASSRALVLLDGVPFSDPFGGWLSYSAIDPTRIGAVRVTRGGGSGEWGPGALAGSIDLSSAGPDQLAPVWGDLAYGSRNSIDAHAGVSGKMGGGYAFLSAGYARGDGFIPIVREDRGPIDQPAPYRQASVSGRAVFPVAANSELQASMLLFSDQRTRGTPYQPNSTKGADASLRLVGKGPWAYETVVYVQERSFSAGFASINASRTIATPTLNQYSVPSTGLGGRMEIRPPINDSIRLRLGADTRYVTGQTQELYQYVAGIPSNQRKAGGRELTFGIFSEASAEPIRNLTLTAGGRIDRWRIMDGFLHQSSLTTGPLTSSRDYADRSGWRPTGRGGIAWKPGQGSITLRSAAYLGWRLPTLNELYRPFRLGQDSTIANALLRPERLRGVDAGVDFDPASTVHIGATLFTNRLSDAISNVTLTGSAASLCPGLAPTGHCIQRQNIAAIVSRGAEMDARLTLGAWRLSASYAYTDAHVRSNTAINGLRPAQTAEHSASGTLGWSSKLIGASTTLRYFGPQFEDDQNSERLKSAVTLDATATIRVNRQFSIGLRGENITDTRVEVGISGSNVVERASPRTLWIGLHFGEARDGG